MKFQPNHFRFAVCLIFLFAFLQGQAQPSAKNIPSVNQADTVVQTLRNYGIALANLGKALANEKAYLHFDNTSYYRGDNIWFSAYVVSSENNRPSVRSKTLYVELLNPGGEVLQRQILPIESNGRCNGSFTLTHLPFYSGFYEVRAYTKYMLNFGDDAIYSRIIPVFDRPEEEGNYEEKRMFQLRYSNNKYPVEREMEKKRKTIVNVKFFPEGGSLVANLPTRLAFEITDDNGLPCNLRGEILNKDGRRVVEFSALHEGRGVVDYTPTEGDYAKIEAEGKTFKFDLPKMQSQGFVMNVDNVSSDDTITVTVSKSRGLPSAMLASALMSGGSLIDYKIIQIDSDQIANYTFSKHNLPAGVARIVLTDVSGSVIADRLIFTHSGRKASIDVVTDKAVYEPYDSISMRFTLRDAEGQPSLAPMSLAVRDGKNEVKSYNTMLTDLLLMSEIKGYVHRPDYYFESDDIEHRMALDHLLMVQGWRRYDWKTLAGVEPFELKYLPEKGIEVHGRVAKFSNDKPLVDGVQLQAMLLERGNEDASEGEKRRAASGLTILETDSLGRFAFVSDFTGMWHLTLSITNANRKFKPKWSSIYFEQKADPAPRAYQVADMQISTDKDEQMRLLFDTTSTQKRNTLQEDYYDNDDYGLEDYKQDTLSDITKRVHRIKEVTVKAEKESREQRIFKMRSSSVAYYDVPAEMDDAFDVGENIVDIWELLAHLFDKLVLFRTDGTYRGTYKNKPALFSINYDTAEESLWPVDNVNLKAIKAIYINDSPSVITEYGMAMARDAGNIEATPSDMLSTYSCVVFIETYPEDKVPARSKRGVRNTWVQGYSVPSHFYHPDYRQLPKENDYRRTLYWNPYLQPDANGEVEVKFFNNSSCRDMRISAETITNDGAIGSLND